MCAKSGRWVSEAEKRSEYKFSLMKKHRKKNTLYARMIAPIITIIMIIKMKAQRQVAFSCLSTEAKKLVEKRILIIYIRLHDCVHCVTG